MKKAKGCVRPSKEVVWKTDVCFACWGEDANCKICNGSNAISVHRCPRALGREVNRLLPFFFDWKESGRLAWPDGSSRLHQPISLSSAFDLLANLCGRYERESIENAGKS